MIQTNSSTTLKFVRFCTRTFAFELWLLTITATLSSVQWLVTEKVQLLSEMDILSWNNEEELYNQLGVINNLSVLISATPMSYISQLNFSRSHGARSCHFLHVFCVGSHKRQDSDPKFCSASFKSQHDSYKLKHHRQRGRTINNDFQPHSHHFSRCLKNKDEVNGRWVRVNRRPLRLLLRSDSWREIIDERERMDSYS